MNILRQILTSVMLLLGIITSVAIPVTERDVSAILKKLDKELSLRDVYINSRKAEIDSLKGLIARKDAPDSLKLSVILDVGDRYSAFNTDSALWFYNEGYRRSRMLEMDSAVVRFALRCATYQPLVLLISRATQLMDSVERAGVPSGLEAEYHDAQRQMNSFISNFYVASPDVFDYFVKKQTEAQSRLIEALDKESHRYKLNLGESYLSKGEYVTAKAVLSDLLDDMDDTHPLYARASHMLADIAKAKGDELGCVYYLALSAISDTRCATLEVTSLQELGKILYSHDDIERSHEYLSIALKNAVDCNVSLRIIQTSQAIPFIESAHRSELASSRRRIYVVIGVLAFLLVLLCVLIRVVKNKNDHLHGMASRLEDANKTKDVYITQFLNLCSIYMDKLNQFNKVVNRKISAGKVDDLFKLTKSGKFVEEQSREFYEVFDDAFLHIYPTIAHDIFRHSSQSTHKQAYTPIASQFQVKMSCIACLYQLSIKHKDIGKARTSFVNRVNKNPENRTPYGYSINNSETDLSERNEPFSKKMSHIDSSGHDSVLVGQHSQTRFRVCLKCRRRIGGKTYRAFLVSRTGKAA